MWKYQTEWEDSFTVKMYLFQFANYYGTIFYIAFIKGRLVFLPSLWRYLFVFLVVNMLNYLICYVEST